MISFLSISESQLNVPFFSPKVVPFLLSQRRRKLRAQFSLLPLTFGGFSETSQDCIDFTVFLLEVRSGIRTLFLCIFPP